MKNDISCDIIRDLMPNCIDNVASKASIEAVNEHIKYCEQCQKIYHTMKNNSSETPSMEDDRALFKTINKKLNKKTKTAVVIGIVAVVAVGILSHVLFSMPLKNVPLTEVSVSASVYPINEISEEYIEGTSDYSVSIYKSENESSPEYIISIPSSPYNGIAVSKSVIDECNYVSLITFTSPYHLDYINFEYKSVGEERVLYVYDFKTTVLNNSSEGNTSIPTIQFEKIDKIVYINDANTETVLWSYE